jgi:beta-phosphoglucomutase-like phosphatase (HAD superfamily)
MNFNERLKNLKAIIFDMDGVLADTEHLHMKAFEIYLGEYRIKSSPEFLQSLIGHSIENNFKMLYEKFPQLADKPIQDALRYRNNLYLDLLKTENVWPVAGIPEILDFCMSYGIEPALASSSDKVQVEAVLEKFDKTIACNFSFKKIFKTVVAGDMVPYKKPAPDIYLKALSGLAASPVKTIAIEDSQTGLKSAKAAGLFCLALENPYNDVYQMPEADQIIKSIYELLNALKNQ